MGAKDYYADGQWNFFCDLCGKKNKSSDGVQTWDKHWVCRHHKEVRNPQDFLRGVKDDPSTPWSRPEGPDQFVPLTWERHWEDPIPLEETVAKLFMKIINSYQGRPLNGNVLNETVLNGSAPNPSGAAELISLSETILIAKLLAFNETLALAETLSPHLFTALSLNGAPLNSTALG